MQAGRGLFPGIFFSGAIEQMDIVIGVLALQGDVHEHIGAFTRALEETGTRSSEVIPVRDPEDIGRIDALAMPGGESTTIARLIDTKGLRSPLEKFEGGIFATCAGMVLMAAGVDNARFEPLGLIEITVKRNAFGRQKESFEADLPILGLDAPFHAYFIRAPVAESCGPAARVMASIEAGIVAVRQGKHMAFAFHPELGRDPRLHILFLEGLGI
jgi:5'-phosphate synthase pdxT subunit